MTNEETAQVNAYNQKLQAQHAHALQVEQKYRKMAQADAIKMGTAVHEIWKLASLPNPPQAAQLAMNVKQIINYYCPDFDVPF